MPAMSMVGTMGGMNVQQAVMMSDGVSQGLQGPGMAPMQQNQQNPRQAIQQLIDTSKRQPHQAFQILKSNPQLMALYLWHKQQQQ